MDTKPEIRQGTNFVLLHDLAQMKEELDKQNK
jgi:hypothetical protein